LVVCASVLAASSFLFSRTAAAEIPVSDLGGWKLSIEGRFNLFVNYSFGDSVPKRAPEDNNALPPGAGGLDNTLDLQQTSAGTFKTIRLRNGYVPNVLAFNLRRDFSERTHVSGHLALWSDIETNLQLYSDALAWMQEGYLKVEGPWGSVLAGRALALFSRGAVEIDFNYGHGFGLGYPCNLGGVHPTCGQIGFGEMFPFFRAGLVYATPSLGGLTFTAGMYDPVILAGKWERVVTPTFEVELAFTRPLGSIGMFKLFSSALWQRLGANSQPGDTRAIADKTVDQSGIAGGARLELGPVRLGFAGHYGRGLGFYYAQENSQVAYFNASDTSDTRDGNLRIFRGFYGQAMLVLGRVSLAGGAGASQLVPLAYDDTTMVHLPKQQLGINGVFLVRVLDNLVLDVDYFRGQVTWWNTSAHQNFNIISAGVTVTF
jgi:hypothetical protein